MSEFNTGYNWNTIYSEIDINTSEVKPANQNSNRVDEYHQLKLQHREKIAKQLQIDDSDSI